MGPTGSNSEGPAGPMGRLGAMLAVVCALLVVAMGLYAGLAGASQPQRLKELAQERAAAALLDAGFPWAKLRIDDSVGVLIGDAPDEPARAALERRARDLLGPYMGLPGVFLNLENRVRVRPRLRAEALLELEPPGAGVPPVGSSAVTSTRSDGAAACAASFEAALGRETVQFRSGSTQLDGASRLVLRRLAAVLSRCPAWRLLVVGHPDARGDALTAERLSRKRASVIAAELLLEGALVEQLETLALVDEPGGGAVRPRRIEFRFLQAEAG